MGIQIFRTDEGTIHMKDGKIHRDGGPAIMLVDGHKEWWCDGQPHRLDGPAIQYNGSEDKPDQWFIHGKEYSENEFIFWAEMLK